MPLPEFADLRNVRDGDPAPKGGGTLRIRRGIEVGHIFQLGTKDVAHPKIASPVTFATPDQIREATGVEAGSIGPVGLEVPIIADNALSASVDFVCGANQEGKHLTGVNWERDLPLPEFADLRNVRDGDQAPKGGGTLRVRRGIEVGHIFQLGTKYSESLQAMCLDENGKAMPIAMGCYGIGVTRVVAAAIEQNHDDKGIIWPTAIAPFHVALLPMNMHKSLRLREAATGLHDELRENGVEVLLDDRQVRPGVMFADMELIGMPHRIVLSDRGLDEGTAEYQHRASGDGRDIPLAEVSTFLADQVRRELVT